MVANSWLASFKPTACNSTQVSLTGGGGLSTWVILCCFVRCISREMDRKWGSQDSDLLWDANAVGDLNLLRHNTGLSGLLAENQWKR